MFVMKIVFEKFENEIKRIEKEFRFEKFLELERELNENYREWVVVEYHGLNEERGNEFGNKGRLAEGYLWEIIEGEIEFELGHLV